MSEQDNLGRFRLRPRRRGPTEQFNFDERNSLGSSPPKLAELEETLRSLPTARPPAELRERILSRASARRARARWRPLAFALGLLALLALDWGVGQVQDARIARLTGDGSRIAVAGGPDLNLRTALAQRWALLGPEWREEELR